MKKTRLKTSRTKAIILPTTLFGRIFAFSYRNIV